MARQGIREIEAAAGKRIRQRPPAGDRLRDARLSRGDKEEVHRICREGIHRFGKKEGSRSSTGCWAWSSSPRRPRRGLRCRPAAAAEIPPRPLQPRRPCATRRRPPDYDRALAISPSFAEAYLNRGSARWAKEDANGAYADFDAPHPPGAQLAGAYNGRGRTLLELMNDPDRAMPDLDEAIRLRPEGYVLPYIARVEGAAAEEGLRRRDRRRDQSSLDLRLVGALLYPRPGPARERRPRRRAGRPRGGAEAGPTTARSSRTSSKPWKRRGPPALARYVRAPALAILAALMSWMKEHRSERPAVWDYANPSDEKRSACARSSP